MKRILKLAVLLLFAALVVWVFVYLYKQFNTSAPMFDILIKQSAQAAANFDTDTLETSKIEAIKNVIGKNKTAGLTSTGVAFKFIKNLLILL